MKNLKFGSISATALVLAQTLQATQISGSIGFDGNVTFNTSSSANATQVTAFSGTQVASDTGTFASFIIPIAGAAFTTATWNMNTSTAINSFWSAGGFTFELLNSSITAQGGSPTPGGATGYVAVSGTGIVSGNGFTATPMIWDFTSQDPQSGTGPAQWTFSASANTPVGTTPDRAITVMLLGFALSGVAMLKKKLVVNPH
jgi:hypothetical protein